jgi:hypothetical protein
MRWDITLSSCGRIWYTYQHVISNVGRCFSIPPSRSLLCAAHMRWTKYCFAALRCSSTSLLSASVELHLMLSKCIASHNLLSQSRLDSDKAIYSTCRASGVCLLQTQDASYLHDQIDGSCQCWRPLSEVYTLPAVTIATASVSDSFRQLAFGVDS